MSTAKQRGPYRIGPPSKRRCWTCRGKKADVAFSQNRLQLDLPGSDFISERKISCDMGRPGCRNCAASFRNCQGYGLRLSWPANGSSRSIHCSIQGSPSEWSNESKPAYFINTLMMDVEIHYLQCPGSVGQLFRLLLNLFVYRVYVTNSIDCYFIKEKYHVPECGFFHCQT
jgi:hypothetical protein